MKSLMYKNEKMVEDLTIKVEAGLESLKGNKYPHWSVTGWIIKGSGRDREETGGAIGEKLVEYFPEIAPFVPLHLSDGKGVPMFAIENGWYYKITKNPSALKDHLRLTDKETDILMNVIDKQSFRYVICVNGISKRWKKDSDEAIHLLEKLTGKKLEATEEELSETIMTEEEVEEMDNKIMSGYYNSENIYAREYEKQKEDREMALDDIQKRKNKRIAEAECMAKLEVDMIRAGVPYPCMLEVYANKEVLVYVNRICGIDNYYSEEEFDEMYEKMVSEDKIPEGFKIIKRE